MNCQEMATLFTYPWEKPSISDKELAAKVRPLVTFVERSSVEELQDLFTRTFDLAPSSPPYLAFHTHGESYRRGTVMARLRALYQRYEIDEQGELPDHVGNIVKLLAVAGPDADLDEIVKVELKPGMDKLLASTSSEDRGNPYRSLLVAAAEALEARLK